MRVLHVAASLSPQWGGPIAMIAGLTRALQKQGVSCTVFAPVGRRVGTDPVWLDGADVRLFPTAWLALGWIGYAPTISVALREALASHDLVHIHELWHFPHYAAYRAAQEAGKPYVVTVHGAMDPWAMRQKWLRKWIYMTLLQRRILQRAAAVQAVTATEADQIRARGIRTPIAVIPNGIDPDSFQNLPPKSVFLQRFPDLEGKQVVLFLGRIHPIKGLDILAHAFPKVLSHHQDVRLVIAGPDEDSHRRRIEALLAAGGVVDRTVFTGMLTETEKLAALAASDVFVLPSYSEGLSLSVLEALASGLPVIITRQCQFPEVAHADAGLVIDPDAGQLHDALSRLLENPVEGRAMGQRGRQMVMQRYTWDSVAARVRKLYVDIVQGTIPHVASLW